MRFFTKELWLGAQDDRSGDNRKKWVSASERYAKQLNKLRPRLSKAALEFFASADIHDGELISFQIVDGSRPAPLNEPPRPWGNSTPYPVRAILVVLDAQDRYLWTLEYGSIRRLVVDYPSDSPLFDYRGQGFSDWGYHELTDAGGDFLRHEVLFASGSTLLVEFKGISVRRRKRSDAAG